MILVTGASGFVGRNLVKELVKRKKVRCLVRQTSNTRQLKGTELFYGDILDKESLFKATKGISIVIHLVAVIGSADYKLNYETHVTGAKNLIEACKKNHVKRMVVISTTSTLAKIRNDYGTTKAMADQLFANSGLAITTLKPDFIYGKDGNGFMKLVDAIKKRPFMPSIGSGKYRKQPVHIDDVVAAIISSMDKKFIGKTYIVASEYPIEFDTMIKMIMKQLGVKKPIVHVPVKLLLAASYIMKVKKNPLLTKTVVLGLSQDCVYNVQPLIKELKIVPRSFEDGLKEVLN
ncbi:MAG: NAD-dependent epimerase/dehydratase family protein [Candidatus Aenigmatarchaeota archaeon]